MRKNEESHGARLIQVMTCILAGGGIAFGASLLVLTAGAALIATGRIPEGAMEQVTLCASAMGCLTGGLYGVLRCRSRVLPVGLTVGAVFYLLWITAGLLTQDGASVTGSIPVLCAGLLGGGVAGFLGARPKKRRK